MSKPLLLDVKVSDFWPMLCHNCKLILITARFRPCFVDVYLYCVFYFRENSCPDFLLFIIFLTMCIIPVVIADLLYIFCCQ